MFGSKLRAVPIHLFNCASRAACSRLTRRVLRSPVAGADVFIAEREALPPRALVVATYWLCTLYEEVLVETGDHAASAPRAGATGVCAAPLPREPGRSTGERPARPTDPDSSSFIRLSSRPKCSLPERAVCRGWLRAGRSGANCGSRCGTLARPEKPRSLFGECPAARADSSLCRLAALSDSTLPLELMALNLSKNSAVDALLVARDASRRRAGL
jgi:hypothetical protein